MSHPSLKEQLQALSIGLSSAPDAENKPTNKNNHHHSHNKSRPAKKNQKPKPAWLEQAQYGVELLRAYFPQCFREVKDVKPLKVGIKQDLVKFLSTREDIVISDKSCMINSLAYYVNSIAYHKAMIEGNMRIDLEGNETTAVTAEEAKYSADCRQAKLQKKQQQKKSSALETEK